MKGQVVGDEIRHIIEQTDIKDTLCRSVLAAHCNSFGFYPGDFRAEGTNNCGKLKLKRQRDETIPGARRRVTAW